MLLRSRKLGDQRRDCTGFTIFYPIKTVVLEYESNGNDEGDLNSLIPFTLLVAYCTVYRVG